METNNLNETPKLVLSKEALSNLFELRKWTKFLAIMGFIFIGFMILLGFAINSILTSIGAVTEEMPYSPTVIGFLYLMIGLLYFFPILYLYKFSSWTKSALTDNNSSDLTEAFKNLKAHFRYIGILTIVMLSLYGIIFIVAVIAGIIGVMS